MICDMCDESCAECSKTPNNCTKCEAPKLLVLPTTDDVDADSGYVGECLDDCPDGLAPINGVCSSCSSNEVIFNGKCYARCNTGLT